MKKVTILFTALLSLLLLPSLLTGQGLTSLSGTVTDPSGGFVPGASLTLFDADTGAKREATSDSSGRYSIAQVTPGTYRLTATAAGFNEVVLSGVQLLVSTPATVNVVFEKVGSQAMTVEVQAGAEQINTTDASLGNAIGEKPISQLPFESRNVVGLLSLQPGVTYFADPQERDDYRSGSVNGGKSDQGNVTLDGVDVNDQQNRTAFTSVLRVTLDSVEEFRTTTTNGGADQGRSSGAQVSLVTKSGSNAVHGALYEYHRNTITTANSFFNNAAGVDRPKLIRNVFGAAAGGPIKKDRLFIFGNYEGRRDASDSGTVRIVPNDTFRQGIFTYNTCVGQVYDANDNCVNPGVGTLTPQQIATIVDPLHIGPDPAILTLLQSYPSPNDNTIGDGVNTAGFRFNSSTPLRYNTYVARVDYQLDSGGKHRLFARGNLQNDHLVDGIPEFPGQPNSSSHLENAKGIAIGYTWVISPTLVNNLRYGLTRQAYTSSGVQTQPYVTPRDIDQIFAGTSTNGRNLSAIIPVHQISDDLSWTRGAHTFQFGGVIRHIAVSRNDQTNSFSDGFLNSSWLFDTGNSLLVADADQNFTTQYVRQMTNLLGLVSEGDAQYNYDKQGNLLAEGAPVSRKYIDKEYELYAMDSWKMFRGLTVSAGLRVSLFPALYEANGNQTSSNIPLGQWFDDRAALAAQGMPQSLVTPIVYNLKDSPGQRGLYPYQRHFAPRFALAYSPQATSGLARALFGGPGKSSFRAGLGMYYDLLGQSLIQLANLTAQGFATQLTSPLTSLPDTAPRFTSTTEIPAGLLPTPPPAGFPQVPPPDLLSITTGVDQGIKSPYTLNADFSYSRELGHGFLFQGAYIGRFSRRSLQGDDVATPTNLKDTTSGMDYFTAANIMQRYVRAGTDVADVQNIPWFENIFPGYAGGGLSATQNIYNDFWAANPGNDTTALAEIDTTAFGCDPCSKFGPYALYNQQYASLAAFRTRGRGNYHAMQLTLRKAFSDGVQFDFNYTFSKSEDLGSTRETDGRVIAQIINPWNPRQMYSVSDYDVRHIVSAFVVAELPFGRGKRFGSNMNRAANAVVGGWQVSGIWRQSSSLPVAPDNGGFWSTNWNIEGFATQVAPFKQGTNKHDPGGPNIFPDPGAAFSAFDLTFPGNSGTRNVIRGDGFFTIDMSLDKRFLMPWSEKHSLQFRAEVFNLTNTARFDVNQSSLALGSPSSFGKYNGTLGTPRVMQFGLRYEF
jgi:hypothetical protein